MVRCHVRAEHSAFSCVFITAGTVLCLPGWEASGKWCSLHSAWVLASLTHRCGSSDTVTWAGGMMVAAGGPLAVEAGGSAPLAGLVTVRAGHPACHGNCGYRRPFIWGFWHDGVFGSCLVVENLNPEISGLRPGAFGV